MRQAVVKIRQNSESGQFLVMLAVMLLALLAMLALVLDGGTLYLRRREAQNAADAGALAGARAVPTKSSASHFMACSTPISPPPTLPRRSLGRNSIGATQAS
jgi:uncharacterized membrane protein